MPEAPPVDQKSGLKRLLDYLSQSGPSKAQSVCEHLKISQPTFSRLISQAPDSIIRIGRGPQTLYACHRQGDWDRKKPEIPIFIINEKVNCNQVATLHPLSPSGFYLESQNDIFSSQFYKNCNVECCLKMVKNFITNNYNVLCYDYAFSSGN